MREIKFRGKRIEDGSWLYGSLFADYEEKLAYMESVGFAPIPVFFESVGQYTGLKDKNGKEIYEGDILDAKRVIRGHVGFKEGNFVVYWDKDSIMKRLCDYENFSHGSMKLLEVIGNIYENPELLNGGEEDAR